MHLIPAVGDNSNALIAGALDHLMRYVLTGCNRSARHAAYLLEQLSDRSGMGEDLRGLCGRMSEALESADDLPHRPRRQGI